MKWFKLIKNILVVTGSRADYGLLKRLMKLIDSDPEMKLQIIVTGSHLSPKHGLTYKEIEEDGFQIGFKVDILENIIEEINIVFVSIGECVCSCTVCYFYCWYC